MINKEEKFSTIDSHYQWLHMWFMHRFVGASGETSILRMRLFNGALFAGLLGLMLVGASRRIAKAGVFGIALTVVPVGIWYITSMSPTGWTIIATSTGWSFAATLGQMHLSRDRDPETTFGVWVNLIGLTLSAVIAFGSRQDGAVLFSLVVVAAFLSESNLLSTNIRMRRINSWKPPTFVVFVLALLAAPRFVSYVSPFVSDNLPVFEASRRQEALLWFSNWVFHYPYLFVAALGAEPMGSQELIRVPAFTWIVMVLVLGRVLLPAIGSPNSRQLAALIPLGLGFVAALWFAGQEFDLYNVPPRYVLPLLPAIIGLTLSSSRVTNVKLGFSSRSHPTLLALGVAHALCLYVILERYTAGSSGGLRSIPVRFDERWWSWPVGPNYVLVLGSIGWWMFLVYSLRFLERRDHCDGEWDRLSIKNQD